NGKLYAIEPGVIINVVGSPIASAKKYLIEKLRCALCGELFSADIPEGVNPNRHYDEGFAAMLMINKYFMATPLYRQATLQELLGMPLPASTQWDIIKAHTPVLELVYDALLRDAANGKGFHLDDTSAKILEVIKAQEDRGKKSKKCFTTGMISIHDDHRCAIFVTDEKTAGKTFAPLWALRDESLEEPFIMADALSANIPNDIEEGLYILCYCLVYARRNFYDLGEGYDDLVDVVLELIAQIYDNEAQTKEMTPEARQLYHQEHSSGIMNQLKTHLEAYKSVFEPNSKAGKAIDYMLKRWTNFTYFLTHPNVPIDNNVQERALKLVIRNRKNSMFYKTKNGAKLAGFIQSLIYSAAQNNINPYDYLHTVLTNRHRI
ncbi:MAG: IS66 family transposase, partial [Alphaproteobacteria bacterium]